jgi:hypothetical protein
MIITAGVDGGYIARINVRAGCRVPILLSDMSEYAEKYGACRRQYQNPNKNREYRRH